MCVWTAYTGRKQAAPVIMEALKKIEGYWAGFYTGLAVCDKGSIRFDKCAGHTGIFERQFSLKDYPGTTGIAHSRTNSGGSTPRAAGCAAVPCRSWACVPIPTSPPPTACRSPFRTSWST